MTHRAHRHCCRPSQHLDSSAENTPLLHRMSSANNACGRRRRNPLAKRRDRIVPVVPRMESCRGRKLAKRAPPKEPQSECSSSLPSASAKDLTSAISGCARLARRLPCQYCVPLRQVLQVACRRATTAASHCQANTEHSTNLGCLGPYDLPQIVELLVGVGVPEPCERKVLAVNDDFNLGTVANCRGASGHLHFDW